MKRQFPAVITAGDGELLVTNRPGFAVSLLPLTEPISPEVIARVSKLINVPVEEIQKNLIQKNQIQMKNSL